MSRPKIRVTRHESDAAPPDAEPRRARIEGSASWSRSWAHGASRFLANQSARRFSIEVRRTWFSALNAVFFMILAGGVAAMFLSAAARNDEQATFRMIIGGLAAITALAGAPSLLKTWLPERWTFDRESGLFIHHRPLRGRVVRTLDELCDLELIEHERARHPGKHSSLVFGRALRLHFTEPGQWLELEPLGGDLDVEQRELVETLGQALARFLDFEAPRSRRVDHTGAIDVGTGSSFDDSRPRAKAAAGREIAGEVENLTAKTDPAYSKLHDPSTARVSIAPRTFEMSVLLSPWGLFPIAAASSLGLITGAALWSLRNHHLVNRVAISTLAVSVVIGVLVFSRKLLRAFLPETWTFDLESATLAIRRPLHLTIVVPLAAIHRVEVSQVESSVNNGRTKVRRSVGNRIRLDIDGRRSPLELDLLGTDTSPENRDFVSEVGRRLEAFLRASPEARPARAKTTAQPPRTKPAARSRRRSR